MSHAKASLAAFVPGVPVRAAAFVLCPFRDLADAWVEHAAVAKTRVFIPNPWKDHSELGSLPMRILVVLMAVSFIVTTALGIVMPVRFGRSRKAAWTSLALGVVIPLCLVLIRLTR